VFANDSSKRARALEKFRKLNEATMNALRTAGAERKRKEQEELALREQAKKPELPESKTKPTMPAA
jgi:hypothetical protein